ncbi:hypothetical protein WJX84_004698 [Apatococcus fuscideae]|uniref:VWFA domain-containing protein n=1 Tax=Apatococcus fuscideae TaxID=2026836 RepID=A0AAW1TFT0_9CHLO
MSAARSETFSESDEDWDVQIGHDAAAPSLPGTQARSFEHSSDALDTTESVEGHSSVGEDGTGLQDPEWVADFEHLTTEDLAEQIEQMRLQVDASNVDEDSSSAAPGKTSRQGLELQLEQLRSQNLTLQHTNYTYSPAGSTARMAATPAAAQDAPAGSSALPVITSPKSTLSGPGSSRSASTNASPDAAARSLADCAQQAAPVEANAQEVLQRRAMEVAHKKIQAREADIRRMAESGSLEVLQAEAAQATERMDRILKGLDLAFLFDITGSMEPWILQAAAKAKDIMAEATRIHPQAVMRMAFVGYRDYGDTQQLEVKDFVEKEGFGGLQSFLDSIVAKGGDDSTEDIAGGLKAVTELSWRSSTRLVIHFGDYPCHGKKYHGEEWEQYDRYPWGDPNGLIPEEFLEKLASQRTDYYFAELTQHTARMAGLFKACFANAANADFHRMDMSKGPEEFMPHVINSIRSSISKSSVLGTGASHRTAPADLGSALAAASVQAGRGSVAGIPVARRRLRVARNLGTD